MGICAEELRSFVIRPVLEHLGDWSQAAENLLLGTAAQESGLGFHLKTRRGHSLGIFQIHPQAHNHLWDKYLVKSPDLASKVRGLASQHEFLSHPHAELATNLSYATAIAWMIYCRSGKPLPAENDTAALAKFWQRHFHSRLRGSIEEFTENYQKFINTDKSDEIAA